MASVCLWLPSENPHPQESGYAHMNKSLSPTPRTALPDPKTSDEKVWESPGYQVVETALEVTAYALADRRAPEPPRAS
ncbi:hypothetical protein SAMN06272765_8936 [Streptomyces sp. Ag109_G2-15]|nr:hypothetical protein SAMN06272765_8936 [Streptomyces sp. Ag109_G2-15]